MRPPKLGRRRLRRLFHEGVEVDDLDHDQNPVTTNMPKTMSDHNERDTHVLLVMWIVLT